MQQRIASEICFVDGHSPNDQVAVKQLNAVRLYSIEGILKWILWRSCSTGGDGGREGGRERGREGGREGREGGEGGRGGREGERDGGMEKEGGEGGREEENYVARQSIIHCIVPSLYHIPSSAMLV